MDQRPLLRRLYRDLFLLLGLGVTCAIGLLLYLWLAGSVEISLPVASRPQSPVPRNLAPPQRDMSDEIVDGIHVASGLIVAEGFEIVRSQCTACHSGKLVTQNRATREGWEEMIRWMQRTQGLWPLGVNEPVILDYLARHYGPEEMGRRANLEVEEWYILELD